MNRSPSYSNVVVFQSINDDSISSLTNCGGFTEKESNFNFKDDFSKKEANVSTSPPPSQALTPPTSSASETAMIDPSNQERASDNTAHHLHSEQVSWNSGISPVPPSSIVALKVLVSNNVAGSIIGRSGQTISELQEQSESRIKLSQSGDSYPGTSDRVCLMHGKMNNVKKAISLVIKKLFDAQLQHIQHQTARNEDTSEDISEDNDTSAMRVDALLEPCSGNSVMNKAKSAPPTKVNFTVRILIPAPACGMLIGRGGSNVKHLAEVSCVSSIRLSPKEAERLDVIGNVTTSERILTITGHDLDSCLNCTHLIIDGIARHPDICRYSNMTTSYSKLTQPRSNGSHYTHSAVSSPPTHGISQGDASSRGFFSPELESRMQLLRTSDSSSVLRPMEQRRDFQQGSIYGVPIQTSPSQFQTSEAHAQIRQTNTAPAHSNQLQFISARQDTNKTSPSQAPVQEQSFTLQIAVPDTIIGGILGKRGHTLHELQSRSNTRIKISQRGVFVPGTNERIVTITGTTSESVATAKTLIRRQIERNNSGRIVSRVSHERNDS